jgi:thiol-disulfide isomerase/thioredoxin
MKPFFNCVLEIIMRMNKITIFILGVLVIITWRCNAQVVIKGSVNENVAIKVFKPIGAFANGNIENDYFFDEPEKFEIKIDIENPTFVKLKFNHRPVILLCEPGDVYELVVDPSGLNPNWISIVGKNAIGNLYVNRVYFANPALKFLEIKEIFETQSNLKVEDMIHSLFSSIDKQTAWVDSLLSLGQITKAFSDLMKVEIKSVLAWSIGDFCDRFYTKDELKNRSSTIKESLFKEISPLDPRLKSCLASTNYYYTYFQKLGETLKEIDTAKVVIPEVYFYSLAPQDIQNFMWGWTLFVYKTFSPDMYDYCSLFIKYKRLFNNGLLAKDLEEGGICELKSDDYINLGIINSDFFLFIRSFSGKRLFIDLWATWCAPCKEEFKYYNSDLIRFMKARKIELIYLSIDNEKQRTKWEKMISSINLKGYHVLAGPKLQASIREIIYNDGMMAIPRYILVDEQGKIRSIDFKRPSNASFKLEITSLFD